MRKQGSSIAAVIITIALLGSWNLPLASEPLPYSKQAPIWLDFDMETIPEPRAYDTGYVYDFLDGAVFQQVKQAFDAPRHMRSLTGNAKEAYNVNTLDEVPDSSWFTNRQSRRLLIIEEISKGVGITDGPAGKSFTVVRGKLRGAQPGFWIKDEKGDTYILKFDLPAYPEMSTTAEIISSRLFHAAGYNVPQYTLFRFTRDQLSIDAKAEITDQTGKKRKMEAADLDEILHRIAPPRDGRYRASASLFLRGKVKGNFKFVGVYDLDKNDIIPHEHRRDLRGLRVLCAWLSHEDMRTENTANVYVTEQGRSFVKHYLMDFGATLGSWSIQPKLPYVGHEYNLDAGESIKSGVMLGARRQPYLNTKDELIYPSVGLYTAKYFEPGGWKQVIQLPAFENLTVRDAYWAAKIVGSFSDEQIRAVVATAEMTDKEAEKYLIEQIIERRDLTVHHWYGSVAALDHFRVEKNAQGYILHFDDMRQKAFGETPSPYEYSIVSAAGKKQQLARGSLHTQRLELNAELLDKIGACGTNQDTRGVARLTLHRRGENKKVDVYLFYDTGATTLRVIGVKHA